MSEPINYAANQMSEKQLELVTAIRDSGVINFEQLGKTVAEITPKLFDPAVVADDYLASGYSSVVKIWKQDVAKAGLEQMKTLQSISSEMQRGVG